MDTIILIGGSKGIGLSLLNSLIEENKVVNISRTSPAISHKNLTHYTCDILQDELPHVDSADALVYCPGSINLKPFSRLSIQEFESDYHINVIGAVKSIQHYLPLLKASSHHPSILLFSSVATKLGMPFHTSIASAKAAVEGLVISLGAELAPSIRVNAIAPTVTNTGLASKLLRNDTMIDKMKDRHPMKTFLQPQNVADLATFLLSKQANTITGQVFTLDCGIVSFTL